MLALRAFASTHFANHCSAPFALARHDLLTAKLHVYGLSEDAVTFVHSYLKCRKQGVKINDTKSVFQILLLGIPEVL